MSIDLKHNQWCIIKDAATNDAEGGELCQHSVHLVPMQLQDGRLIGQWILPLALLIRFGDSIRNICIYCLIDRIKTTLEQG